MSKDEECLNPIFYRILKDMQDDAYRRNNMNMMFVYKKAAESIKTCRYFLKTPKEAQKLKGIGFTIVENLEKKLKDIRMENNWSMDNLKPKYEPIITEVKKITSICDKPKPKPIYYQILLAIYKEHLKFFNVDWVLESRLENEFLASYTNIKSIKKGFKILLTKGLVEHHQSGEVSLYRLTKNGIIASGGNIDMIGMNCETLSAGSFDILLVVDKREIHSLSSNTEYMNSFFSMEKVNFSTSTLPIGDFLWICRAKEGNVELVLDYIVERKREDDLISSIIDGRFVEQKARLKKPGVKNVIYIIEKYTESTFSGNIQNLVNNFGKGRFLSTMLQTQITDGFFIKYTSGFKETLSYIAKLTKRITSKYKDRDISSYQSIHRISEEQKDTFMTYSTFKLFYEKNYMMTKKDVFINQLQCIKQMSYKKAVSVTKFYPTLCHLLNGYDDIKDEEGKKNMISDIVYDGNSRTIGSSLSRRVFSLFNDIE